MTDAASETPEILPPGTFAGGDEEAAPAAPPSRRQFLQKTGAVVAGAALADAADSPRHAYPVDTAPRKIRIGVVGGSFGTSFQWHEHPDCVVEAVSDLRADRREILMRAYGCAKSYNSLEELVRDKNIDAVAVFTDGPLHVQHVEECMRHGKHAISAVPAAMATLDECHRLKDAVETYGLTYMMAETSYYQQVTISARKFYREGKFGELYASESEYQHAGLEALYLTDGRRNWRWGMAPMHYPTHCTAHLIAVTGERLTDVVCYGWGNDEAPCKDNIYGNPFWNETAMFKTDRGHPFRVHIWWKGAHRGGEQARWIGTKMSFYGPHSNGLGPLIVRVGNQTEKDDAGFERALPNFEPYDPPKWWATDMLPEPLRHDSGHEGSHTFLTHEFIDALTHDRRPAVDVHEALAYTAPGIVAHESALRGGESMKIPSFDKG